MDIPPPRRTHERDLIESKSIKEEYVLFTTYFTTRNSSLDPALSSDAEFIVLSSFGGLLRLRCAVRRWTDGSYRKCGTR